MKIIKKMRHTLSPLRTAVRRFIKNPNVETYRITKPAKLKNIRNEFRHVSGYWALQTLLDNHDFKTILDIGSGAGKHSDIFIKYNKHVTCLAYGYNLSVVVKKKSIQEMPNLSYDKGDLSLLKDFFPKPLQKQIEKRNSFYGNISEIA